MLLVAMFLDAQTLSLRQKEVHCGGTVAVAVTPLAPPALLYLTRRRHVPLLIILAYTKFTVFQLHVLPYPSDVA